MKTSCDVALRLSQLGDDLVPVRDEHAHALPRSPDICAQVVLQILDPDSLDGLHRRRVATRSYFVKWP
jgi:hypothetical protein